MKQIKIKDATYIHLVSNTEKMVSHIIQTRLMNQLWYPLENQALGSIRNRLIPRIIELETN